MVVRDRPRICNTFEGRGSRVMRRGGTYFRAMPCRGRWPHRRAQRRRTGCAGTRGWGPGCRPCRRGTSWCRASSLATAAAATRGWSGARKRAGRHEVRVVFLRLTLRVGLIRYLGRPPGLCLMQKYFGFCYCITFVCLLHFLSNYKITRIKKFVSRFTVQLVFIFVYI